MEGKSWSEAVAAAIRRHVLRTGSTIFDRQTLIDAEGQRILIETGSGGTTPWQTLSRVLQELRDEGLLEFVGTGTYRYNGLPALPAQTGSTKGVLVTGSHSIYGDQPKDFYRFPPNNLSAARRMVGQWIVYLEPRRAGGQGYFAVAQMERIEPDPTTPGMHLADGTRELPGFRYSGAVQPGQVADRAWAAQRGRQYKGQQATGGASFVQC